MNYKQFLIFFMMLIVSLHFLSKNLISYNNWYIIQNCISLGIFAISVFMIGYYSRIENNDML